MFDDLIPEKEEKIEPSYKCPGCGDTILTGKVCSICNYGGKTPDAAEAIKRNIDNSILKKLEDLIKADIQKGLQDAWDNGEYEQPNNCNS